MRARRNPRAEANDAFGLAAQPTCDPDSRATDDSRPGDNSTCRWLRLPPDAQKVQGELYYEQCESPANGSHICTGGEYSFLESSVCQGARDTNQLATWQSHSINTSQAYCGCAPYHTGPTCGTCMLKVPQILTEDKPVANVNASAVAVPTDEVETEAVPKCPCTNTRATRCRRFSLGRDNRIVIDA